MTWREHIAAVLGAVVVLMILGAVATKAVYCGPFKPRLGNRLFHNGAKDACPLYRAMSGSYRRRGPSKNVQARHVFEGEFYLHDLEPELMVGCICRVLRSAISAFACSV